MIIWGVLIQAIESCGMKNRKQTLTAICQKLYLIRDFSTRLAIPYLSTQEIEYLDKKNQEMNTPLEQSKPEKRGGLEKDFHFRKVIRFARDCRRKTTCDLTEMIYEREILSGKQMVGQPL